MKYKNILVDIAIFILITLYLLNLDYLYIFINNFERYSIYRYFSNMLITIILGILIGGFNLVSEVFKTGKWKFTFVKFIIFGVPSLILGLLGSFFSDFNDYYSYSPLLIRIWQFSPKSYWYFGVVFGFILVASIYKLEFKEDLMKNKKVLGNGIIFILTIIYLYNIDSLSSLISHSLSPYLYYYYQYISESVMTIILGVFIGCFYVINELSKAGKWKFALVRFIMLGLPSLVFGLLGSSLQLYDTFNSYPKWLIYLWSLCSESFCLFSIVFGFILMSSFYKAED